MRAIDPPPTHSGLVGVISSQAFRLRRLWRTPSPLRTPSGVRKQCSKLALQIYLQKRERLVPGILSILLAVSILIVGVFERVPSVWIDLHFYFLSQFL